MAFPVCGQKNLRQGRLSEVGNSYFLTFATHDRRPFANLNFAFRILQESLHYLGKRGIITPTCLVVMPEHVHLVFRLDQLDLATVMQRLKTYTARGINQKRGEKGKVWSSQYYEHLIRQEESLEKIIEYCRYNPVRRNLVDAPEDWPYWWCDQQL